MVQKKDVCPVVIIEVGEVGEGGRVVVKVAEYEYGVVVK